MSYQLKLEWHGPLDQVTQTDLRLFPMPQGQPGSPLIAQTENGGFVFHALEADSYLLAFRYELGGKHFDSCYFQLDVPDTSLIQLELQPQGAMIDQMGFVNQQGEFVDMLIYQDAKPFLTQKLEDMPFLEPIAEFLAFGIAQLPAAEARARLNQLLGPLDQVFAELEKLWPYQLKLLIQPSYLVQTSAEWKACLLHLLRNNLILMDDEGLHERLQEAIELAQQQERVTQLSELLEWDSSTLSWQNLEQFMQELKGKQMAA